MTSIFVIKRGNVLFTPYFFETPEEMVDLVARLTGPQGIVSHGTQVASLAQAVNHEYMLQSWNIQFKLQEISFKKVGQWIVSQILST